MSEGNRAVKLVGMRKTPSAEHLDVDLAGVAARFDEWIGRPSGIAIAVPKYRTNRDRVGALEGKARKAAIRTACEKALARGSYHDGRRRIERVSRPDRTFKRLTSEAVRQAAPALWEASRAVQVRLAIKAPQPARPLPVIRAVSTDVLISELAREHDWLTAAKAAETASREAVMAVFTEVEQATDWRGELLATTDGWTIGYTSGEMFSAKLAAQLAPQFDVDVEAIKVEVITRGSTFYRIVDLDSGDDDGGDSYAE